MTYSNETMQLLNALGARPIAYHPAFARVWGVKSAILLGQLIYWHGKQANEDGWIRKTVAEINDETALSENEQEVARRVLVQANAVEFKRMGVPAMPHYRVNHAAIADALTGKNDGNSAKQDSPKQPDQLGGNRLSSQVGCSGDLLGGFQLSNTEITSETTAEITSEDAEGACAPSDNNIASNSAGNLITTDFDALAREKGIHNQKAPHSKGRKRKVEPVPSQPVITHEMLSHFAVSAHREIISVLLDAFCAQQIIAKVSDEARWREVLTDWRLHPTWKRDNLAGQLDRYEHWNEITAQARQASPLRHPEPVQGALTGAAKIAQETYERQMAGIQSAVEAAQGGWYGNA